MSTSRPILQGCQLVESLATYLYLGESEPKVTAEFITAIFKSLDSYKPAYFRAIAARARALADALDEEALKLTERIVTASEAGE